MFVCGFVELGNLQLLKQELQERARLVPDCALLAGSELQVAQGLLYMFALAQPRDLSFRVTLKAPRAPAQLFESLDPADPDQLADWALNNRADGTQHSQLRGSSDASGGGDSAAQCEAYREEPGRGFGPGLARPAQRPAFFDEQTEEFLRRSKRHAEDRLQELERESSLRRSSSAKPPTA